MFSLRKAEKSQDSNISSSSLPSDKNSSFLMAYRHRWVNILMMMLCLLLAYTCNIISAFHTVPILPLRSSSSLTSHCKATIYDGGPSSSSSSSCYLDDEGSRRGGMMMMTSSDKYDGGVIRSSSRLYLFTRYPSPGKEKGKGSLTSR